MAEMQVCRALHHKTPSAADRFYQPGDQVLAWRENIVNHCAGELLGPFTVLAPDEPMKLVYVQDAKIGAAQPLNVVRVKRYLTGETISVNVARSFMMQPGGALSNFRTRSADLETTADVLITEIITPRDPEASSPEMTAAKKAEINSLLARGTFEVILKEEPSPNGNIRLGRYFLAFKSTEDDKIKYKARYVIGVHRGMYKYFIVYSTSTLQPQPIKLLLTLAAVFGIDIWTSDVRQVNLQSAETLARHVFIRKLVQEFELDLSQCLKVFRPL